MENQDKTLINQAEPNDFLERAKTFEECVKELKDTYAVDYFVKLDFPMYRELPTEVQLALEIFKKHGGQYLLTYKDRRAK